MSPEEIPAEFLAQMADLTSHRIEGIAVMGNIPFSVPIITQVEGNLWQGGSPTPAVPEYFAHVLNLYPWGGYVIPPGVEVRTERLYDHGDLPDTLLLETLAIWVNERRKLGPTLVHCQAGLNRSALVAGLALIRAGMPNDEAIELLRRRSPAVLCNVAFAEWLRHA